MKHLTTVLIFFSVIYGYSQSTSLSKQNFSVTWPCDQASISSPSSDMIIFQCTEADKIMRVCKHKLEDTDVSKDYIDNFMKSYKKNVDDTKGKVYCNETTFLIYRALEYQFKMEVNGNLVYSSSIIFVKKNLCYTLTVSSGIETDQIFHEFIGSFKLTTE